MSSCNHSEEQHMAQLQLELRTLSTFGGAWEELYWQFLGNTLHRRFDFRLLNPLPHDLIPPQPEFRVVQRNWRPLHPLPRLQEPSNRCILCFDDVAIDSSTKIPCGIACPRNHVIHRQCLDSLIVNHCETVLHTPSTPSHVNCPACFSETTSYSEDQLKRACGGASQQALDLLASVAQADQNLAALPEDEQITNGNTDCYLCPKCKFGPVAHQACANLMSHHAHGGVSNMCPKCGFLGSSIFEWIQIAAPRASTINHEFRLFGYNRGLRGGLRFEREIPFDGFVQQENLQGDLELEHFRLPTFRPRFSPRRDAPPAPDHVFEDRFETLFSMLAPSYLDAVMSRLMRTAIQAAAASNPTAMAITNGSESSGGAVELSHSTLLLSEEIVSEQSLVVTRHACRRVQRLPGHQRSVHLGAQAMLHRALGCIGMRVQAALPCVRSDRLVMIGFDSEASLFAALSSRCKMAFDYASARDGRVMGGIHTEVQLEERHGKQLECCRVV